MSLAETSRPARPRQDSRSPRTATPRGRRDALKPAACVGSVLAVAAALGVRAAAAADFLGVTSVALVFLMGVLASAVAYGLWPSLLACLLSALAYNFFFLPPLYTFTIADPENVVTLLVFAWSR